MYPVYHEGTFLHVCNDNCPWAAATVGARHIHTLPTHLDTFTNHLLIYSPACCGHSNRLTSPPSATQMHWTAPVSTRQCCLILSFQWRGFRSTLTHAHRAARAAPMTSAWRQVKRASTCINNCITSPFCPHKCLCGPIFYSLIFTLKLRVGLWDCGLMQKGIIFNIDCLHSKSNYHKHGFAARRNILNEPSSCM